MADIVSKEQRSRNMSAIRSKDTKPELYIRKLLYADGYRYRKNDASVYGHPDMFLSKYNTAIFIHGCFWHRHRNCRFAYTPKTRIDFWSKKFQVNVERDLVVKKELNQEHIRILVIWECTVKQMQKSEVKEKETLRQIEAFLTSDEQYREL